MIKKRSRRSAGLYFHNATTSPTGDSLAQGGDSFNKKRFSYENPIIHILSESGFRTIMMNAPAPVLGTENAKTSTLPCIGNALNRGALPNMNF
jgi:hypothetical protein